MPSWARRGGVGLGVAVVAVGLALWMSGRPYVAIVVAVVAAIVAVVAMVTCTPSLRRFLPAVVPVALAALTVTAGQSDRINTWSLGVGDPGLNHRALIFTAVGAVALVLVVAGVNVTGAIQRVGHGAAHAVQVIGTGALFLLAIIPAWAWSSLRRRDHFRRRDDSSWHRVDTRDGSTRPGGTRRSPLGRLSWALGCVVLIGTLNYGLGLAWDTATAPVTAPTKSKPALPAQGAAPLPHDPRADLPAMAAYPWRNQYFDDIRRTTTTYWPFTESRPAAFRSRYVNITGWTRRSYTATGDPAHIPTVWMFGGSTTWGEGQRDDYTIPSWIARLSERAGTPIRVVNYGQRGWTHFQEMILFEQLLAERPAPDMATFYDGANEVNAQSLITEPAPSHPLVYSYAERLYGSRIATEVRPTQPAIGWRDFRQAYSRHSLIAHVVGEFTGQAAGAATNDQPSVHQPSPGDGISAGPGVSAGGQGVFYNTTEQDGIDAGHVYARAQSLTRAIAANHHVPALYFWQPMGFDGLAEQRARALLPIGTIDIHTALQGHPNVFIDGGHTNEEGARIAAEAIWKHLAGPVATWYSHH